MLLDLLIHTLTWGFAFIIAFNSGIMLAMFLTIKARKKRERRNKNER